jgi:hypothetical protein
MDFAKKYNMGYLQTSAAMGINIREAFELITRKILERVEQIKYFEMKTIKQKPLTLCTMPFYVAPRKKPVPANQQPKKKCCQ